ncbi:transferase [Flavivirga aquatica]|uniref:Transferase n=1 Tax=Flavivirga aquatica TaxID=1849968 RepID=A0A1E5TB21_9FLAO|nr:acetyltransferase [Flavivirga aquatica]OEK08546.1 transferase [Flavivirga aquatica]
MKNILIIGASGHSKMIIDIIKKNDKYNIVGLIDSFKTIGQQVYGYEIIGNEKDIPNLTEKHNIIGAVIGIGDNWTRKQLKESIQIKNPNLFFPAIVHPSAILADDISIPNGTVIMPGAIINANSKIGEFCIINSNSSLGHDSKMDDFSSLASGVTIGGNVKIGFCTAISLGASVIQNINIGRHTLIGAGALVIKDIEDYKKALGVPINKIKNRSSNEKYLS